MGRARKRRRGSLEVLDQLDDKAGDRFAIVDSETFKAFARADIPSGAFLVLAALLLHTDRSRKRVWPGQETLAERTGLGVRQVRRRLKQLVAGGMLRIEKRGNGKSDNYYFLW